MQDEHRIAVSYVNTNAGRTYFAWCTCGWVSGHFHQTGAAAQDVGDDHVTYLVQRGVK